MMSHNQGRPGVDFAESAEHRALRAAVGDIAAKFGPRYYAERAAARRPCTELWQALGDAGFLGVNIGEEYGGGGGGLTELALVCEEIAAAGTPLLLLLVSAAISAEMISEFGTEEQRQAWLPGLASGAAKVVFAITEPDAGSNTLRISTTATRDGETYRANRATQLAVLDELGKQLELAIAGGGERYQQRHRDRGRLLARERIELLLDPDSPFLELSSLAAWGTEFTVGASVVTGVGVVSGVECVIVAHDPTVRGGAMNPYSLRKILRALEIARTNRLPVMNLVESGGADLPSQADLFRSEEHTSELQS